MATTRFAALHDTENGVSRANVHVKAFGQTHGASKRSVLGNIGNQELHASKKPKILGNALDAAPVDMATAKPQARRTTRSSTSSRTFEQVELSKAAINIPDLPEDVDTEPMDTREETMALAQLPPGVRDIDEEDALNPQMAAEYVNEIYAYMRELEVRYAVSQDYLSAQPEINAKMRAILIDWLVEVHHRFELLQETMYLTVNILDRYLSKQKAPRNKLQLVGVTAMLIASKYEEMYPPEVGDFVYISDNAYTREEILRMEQHMLYTIDFSLGNPLPLHFLRRNSKAGEADAALHTMAKYLMELTMCSVNMLQFLPSQIAAAATYLSRQILAEEEVWSDTLSHYSHYSQEEITPCVQALMRELRASVTSKQQAVRQKFSKSKYLRISSLPELEKFIASISA